MTEALPVTVLRKCCRNDVCRNKVGCNVGLVLVDEAANRNDLVGKSEATLAVAVLIGGAGYGRNMKVWG